jgi:hypothetical protein
MDKVRKLSNPKCNISLSESLKSEERTYLPEKKKPVKMWNKEDISYLVKNELFSGRY